jgi:DNA-binding MarR family transcriptional regulator
MSIRTRRTADPAESAIEPAIGDAEYTQLLDFRDGIRRFLHWSEAQARAVGLTAAQHQLLLAIRGHREAAPGDQPEAVTQAPTIGDVAAHLLLRHHSAVELVGRALAAGLIEKFADDSDHRIVRLSLSADGERRLAALTQQHLEELRRLAPQLRPLWAGL